MGNWTNMTLGDLASFKNGKSRPTSAGTYPVYGGNGILDSANTYNSEGEVVVVGRVGAYCGSVYYENRKIWISDNALFATPRNGFNARFLFYFLKNLDLNSFAEGSSHPLLTQSLLNSIEIYTNGDPDEQRAIAEVLSSLDDKIDLLHSQNKTLESLAETLFRYWFIDRANDDWEAGLLTDEFDFVMGQSPRGETFNENGDGMIFYQGRTDFGFRFPEPRVYTVMPTRIAEKFDTLVSVRAPVGDMNMAIEECCLGRGVAAFRYRRRPQFHSYTYYKLRSLMNEIKQYEESGTVFGSIGKEDFKKLANVIPDERSVDKFQLVIQPLDAKIYENTVQVTALEKMRDSLLPKLMNGDALIA